MLESLQQVQTVQIGTEFYRLVEVKGEHSRLAWEETFEDENAFQGGTPNILFAPGDTWHMGGFKSREGVPGTSEYGRDTDGRWPNKLVPGPKITLINLTDNTTEPTGFFEALGELFVLAGQKVFRVDPSDDSVTLSKDFGAGIVSTMGLRWDEDRALVCTATPAAPANARLYKLAALASPDVWSQTGISAHLMAGGLDRLFKVDYKGLLKNLLTGLPLIETNFADEVQCGDTDNKPTALVAYERTALVGKPEGLFGVNEEGKGIPLIRRMPTDVGNCLGMYVVEPYVLVPHERGCFRFMPGFVEAVGLEREILNESVVRGFFRAFALDGQWIYALVPVGANTYVVVGREARYKEDSPGPYIWDTLTYLPGVSHAIHVSRLWDPPRVFYGYGVSIVYSILSAGGGAPDPEGSDYRFPATGVRYTHRYHFGDWKDKDFIKVDAVGKGCDATTYWLIWYSVDGGAYAKVDIDDVEMRVDENKLHTFTLPVSAKGKEIQFKLEYVGASDSAMGQLIHFKPYAVPTALKLRHYNLTLYLAGEARHDGGVEQRTSLEQLNDLYALVESASGIACNGPWGDITIHPRRMRVLEVRQEGHSLPRFLVELVAQKRETS